jgi:hypothetical protein
MYNAEVFDYPVWLLEEKDSYITKLPYETYLFTMQPPLCRLRWLHNLLTRDSHMHKHPSLHGKKTPFNHFSQKRHVLNTSHKTEGTS